MKAVFFDEWDRPKARLKGAAAFLRRSPGWQRKGSGRHVIQVSAAAKMFSFPET